MNRRELIGLSLAGALVACRERVAPTSSKPVSQTSAPTTSPITSPITSPVPTSAATQVATTVVAPQATTTAETPQLDFTDLDAFINATGGRALIIVKDAQTVHEWYRNDDPTFTRDIASAQKSVLSLLVGIAIDKQLFTLDTTIDSVLGSGWATGDTSSINVLHLLTMTSGLDNRLLVIDAPGRVWRYNNAFSVLFTVLTATTERTLNEIATEWLFAPIGATGAEFRDRPNLGATSAIGLHCTAGHLGAIGAMVLNHQPRQISQGWLDQSFAPSQALNPAYGLLWWLNGQQSYLVPEGLSFAGPLIPSAPHDLVAALGKDDQKLYISPSADLVVARLGDKAEVDARLALSSFDNDLWARITTLGLT